MLKNMCDLKEFCESNIDIKFPCVKIKYNEEVINKTLLASEALYKFICLCDLNDSILDIGCGKYQIHSNIMKNCGLNPQTNDLFENCDYKDFYNNIKFEKKFNAIWVSHVLEHILDINDFLIKIKNDIEDNGILAITVPPLKREIVSGHINLFNAGLLLYRLVMAGFNCNNAIIKTHGYNISIILPNVKKIKNIPHINSHINSLKEFFPSDLNIYCGFNGEIDSLNW